METSKKTTATLRLCERNATGAAEAFCIHLFLFAYLDLAAEAPSPVRNVPELVRCWWPRQRAASASSVTQHLAFDFSLFTDETSKTRHAGETGGAEPGVMATFCTRSSSISV